MILCAEAEMQACHHCLLQECPWLCWWVLSWEKSPHYASSYFLLASVFLVLPLPCSCRCMEELILEAEGRQKTNFNICSLQVHFLSIFSRYSLSRYHIETLNKYQYVCTLLISGNSLNSTLELLTEGRSIKVFWFILVLKWKTAWR